MMGHTIPLQVATSIEAYVGDDGQPRLTLQGKWNLQLDNPFGITDQPPGPAEAATRLTFRCNILLKPDKTTE